MIAHNIPAGWMNPFFGWKLGLNWDGILEHGQHGDRRRTATSFFSIIIGLMFFKGVLASLAGPAPNYDMQRILATRNPREAWLMNGMVTRRADVPALHDDRRHHGPGARVLHAASCRRMANRTSRRSCRSC